MRRGMVIKQHNDFAIIATDDSDFIKIKIKEGMEVGQKIFFFDEDIISMKEDNKKRSNMSNSFKAAAALAACIVIAIMMNNPFVRDTQPFYAMVSFDVNPSFELGIDETFKVVQINAMNEESKRILDKELMGKPLRIAVSKILSDIEASGYALASDNAILVSTVNFKDHNNEPLQKIVAQGVCLAMSENPVYKNTKVIFIDAGKEDLKAAKKEKLSIGKYQLFEMSDDKIDKTTISEGKVSELIEEEEIKDDFEKDKTIQIMDGAKYAVERLQGMRTHRRKWITSADCFGLE
ncbi:MAG: anti-sigma factor domain-containing protein [Clostridia bacterium]|nr:anti-sigma factor domain-containing protein [Clostridia bacterium]